MKTSELIKILESWAPFRLQESYDNSGLLVGSYEKDIQKALISLDCTEDVIIEAKSNHCDIIIAHHPILFGGISRLNGTNYVERAIIRAIKEDISILAIHTNLDNILQGVNQKIAEKLNLKNLRILSPKTEVLRKLVVFIPETNFEIVSRALFEAGAGHIGNYSHCGFSQSGTGSFMGSENSQPHIGKKNNLEKVSEIRFETVYPLYLEPQIIKALLATHPYEEVAYDIYSIENTHLAIGSGLIGELESAVELKDFLKEIQLKFHVPSIKHTSNKSKVQKIALCGGSGSFLRKEALRQGADLFMTSDLKYHEWFDHDEKIDFVDIGHYESEQFTPILISEYLKKNAVSLPTQISGINTNPVKYYI